MKQMDRGFVKIGGAETMLDPARVVEALKQKPEMVHVILTGRNAHPSLVEIADTVTEMREVKHAYQNGILAQRGIEY
jgi:cob(I)alamin adenosyltransferase